MKLKLNSPWFDLVKDGKKKYDVRENTKETDKLFIGDVITFSHKTDKTKKPYDVVVGEILHFKTFRLAIRKMGIDKLMPGAKTINKACLVYQQYVTLADQRKNGVIVIGISPI